MAKSNVRILCGGRLTSGSDLKGLFGALLLLIAPTVLFFVFEGVYWWNVFFLIPVLTGCFFLFSLVTLLSAAFMDPGIIPRRQEAKDDSLAPMKIKVVVKGHEVDCKSCFTCNLYRPPRASHCSICNNCVERFDHHCPWLSNCVGRRNYKVFLAFVFGVVLYGAIIFALCLARFVLVATSSSSTQQAFRQAPVAFALLLYALAGIGAVGFLAQFHCQLLAKNMTTNEFILMRYADGNPYKRGFWEEIKQVMCLSPPPSFVLLNQEAVYDIPLAVYP